MSKSDLMSAEREIELIRQLPNKKALDELVLSNLGLVHKIVHKFPIKNASCGYEDLYHAGIEGLVYGIHKFDVTRGYRLSTYVYRWIQAYVSRYYQNHGKTIRIPVHLATTDMKVKKQVEELTRELGHTPSQAEIESVIDDASVVSSILAAECKSLNQIVSEDEELECFAGEDKTEATDYELQCELMLDELKTKVTDRDFNMFIFRNGLMGKREHTLDEIAEFHGVTRSRVHQVTKQCINLMRQAAFA